MGIINGRIANLEEYINEKRIPFISSCELKDNIANAEGEIRRLNDVKEILNYRLINLETIDQRLDTNIKAALDFENLAEIESKLLEMEHINNQNSMIKPNRDISYVVN